jgi:hypothetical protein
LVANQSAGRPFSISAYLSDAYGNLLPDNGVNISLSLVALNQTMLRQEWPLSTGSSVLGVVSFSQITINKTLATCAADQCFIPTFSLVFSGQTCSNQSQCLIQSTSNQFSLDSDTASNLVLLSNEPKLGASGSFQEVRLQIQDKFGNINLNQKGCPSMCATVGAPFKLTVVNSNTSGLCVSSAYGHASLNLALDKEATDANLQFSCSTRDVPILNGTIARLNLTSFRYVRFNSIILLSEPQSSRAGTSLHPQPTIQICAACENASMCCLFNASGIANVDLSLPGADSLTGNLSIPVVGGIGIFKDLKVFITIVTKHVVFFTMSKLGVMYCELCAFVHSLKRAVPL